MKAVKKIKKRGFSQLPARYTIPALGAAFIMLARMMPGLAEWYGRTVYPAVAFLTGGFAALFPGLSVYDLFLTLLAAGSMVLIGRMAFGRVTVRHGCGILLRGGIWMVVLFYFCWGLNYFRPGFYQRYGLEPVTTDPAAFEKFAAGFIDRMNRSYPADPYDRTSGVFETLRNGYDSLNAPYRLPVNLIRKPKPMLYSRLMAGMGIKGYIGAYFNEATVNRFLLPEQYAFTAAHELAHGMGVAGEAEANFYAFLVCSRSARMPVRFSGYISVLPYLLGNTRQILSPEQYDRTIALIRPEVKALYMRERRYWQSLYYPAAGKVQDVLYDLFLRGNRIEAGRNDYSGVIGYLMAVREEGGLP